jgi:ribosomal protein S6--L-glutamate ligase
MWKGNKSMRFCFIIGDESIAPTREICKSALDIGNIFGLEIYGIDVVETAEGLVLLDINDFPSFRDSPNFRCPTWTG